MKKRLAHLRFGLLAILVLLTGCASTLTSEVTAFHQWPANATDKSFAMADGPPNDLQYRAYADLVRAELHRLGFSDAAATPALQVSLHYTSSGRDVREVYPVRSDPFWPDTPFRYGPWPGPYYGSPFWGPPWYSPPLYEYRESRYLLNHHELKIGITRIVDKKLLYDVTVDSETRNTSLTAAMPYMVHSAFADFPGPSGVARKVEMKMQR